MSATTVEQLLRSGQQQEADALWRQQTRRNPVMLHPNHDASPRVLRLVATDLSVSYLDGTCNLAKAYIDGHWEADHFLLDQGLGTVTGHLFADTDPRKVVNFIRKTKREIIVNCIADPDLYPKTLEIAEQVVREARLPVINSPSSVRGHARDEISRRLQEISHLTVPETIRAVAQPDLRTPFGYPFIARACGTQTGKTMELINRDEEFETFLERHSAREIYLTRFVDFRSDDGLYRKYRVRAVGDDIVANHLLIGPRWKVHGLAAREFVSDRPALLAEEEAYLCTPVAHLDVLKDIHRRIGVDFYGIDYAVLPSGSLLFFEANAAMRSIYPEWRETFPQTWTVTRQLVNRFIRHLKSKAEAVIP